MLKMKENRRKTVRKKCHNYCTHIIMVAILHTTSSVFFIDSEYPRGGGGGCTEHAIYWSLGTKPENDEVGIEPWHRGKRQVAAGRVVAVMLTFSYFCGHFNRINPPKYNPSPHVSHPLGCDTGGPDNIPPTTSLTGKNEFSECFLGTGTIFYCENVTWCIPCLD